MKKTIKELYNFVLKRAEFYGIKLKLNWRLKYEVLTSFEASIDKALGTTDWTFDDKISIEDFNIILDGFGEFFEGLHEKFKELEKCIIN